MVEARAAVRWVKLNLPAKTTAQYLAPEARRNRTACPVLTVSSAAADVSAGAAVVRIEIHGGACPVATGRPRGATGVGTAASTEAAGVAVARPAGRQALIPLCLVGTPPAEGPAPIRPGSPGGPRPPRTEYRAG